MSIRPVMFGVSSQAAFLPQRCPARAGFSRQQPASLPAPLEGVAAVYPKVLAKLAESPGGIGFQADGVPTVLWPLGRDSFMIYQPKGNHRAVQVLPGGRVQLAEEHGVHVTQVLQVFDGLDTTQLTPGLTTRSMTQYLHAN